jgi:cell wall-associated NlpC family hydrolase
MAHFNFSLKDFANGKNISDSIIDNQKNYTPTGEAKWLSTTYSKTPVKANTSMTTANISDILQGQLLYKDPGLVATQFNEVLSSDMAKLLSASVDGKNTYITKPMAQLVGYDIPAQSDIGSIIVNNIGTASAGTNASTSPATGAPNTGGGQTGVPTPIPESGTAVEFALSRIGCRYVWAAEGPDTFDCSGLVTWSYRKVGINLPHYSGAQYNITQRITEEQLQSGDLIFWGGNGSEHVSIYIGNNEMVHAFDGVQKTLFIFSYGYWWKKPSGYGRVVI